MKQISQTVQSRVFQLTAPYQFEEKMIERVVGPHEVVVQPYLASICHADLRYFTGNRSAEALAKKLPMALLHEGIAHIMHSDDPSYPVGARVVIVPNIPGYALHGTEKEHCCDICQKPNGQNYCTNGVFLGSGYDGIGQSQLVLPKDNVLLIPDDIPDDIAVLAELSAVSHQAASNIANQLTEHTVVAVFGDGPVGYLTASVLHHVYGFDAAHLRVFGADQQKLQHFHFATTAMVQQTDFTEKPLFDIAFECTGGKFSASAINQAIDGISRRGTIVLMGVSEQLVPINTRDVLEKGLHFVGSSRSVADDFREVLKAMTDPSYQQTLQLLLPEKHMTVTKPQHLHDALELASEHRSWQKILLDFQW